MRILLRSKVLKCKAVQIQGRGNSPPSHNQNRVKFHDHLIVVGIPVCITLHIVNAIFDGQSGTEMVGFIRKETELGKFYVYNFGFAC